MEQLLEWMEIIQDVRQYRKVDINFRGGAVTCTRHQSPLILLDYLFPDSPF